jgi:hypothetical protein
MSKRRKTLWDADERRFSGSLKNFSPQRTQRTQRKTETTAETGCEEAPGRSSFFCVSSSNPRFKLFAVAVLCGLCALCGKKPFLAVWA